MSVLGKYADTPSPVIALTVIDSETTNSNTLSIASRIQVVVREPSTNKTHPNVVSVPTHRIPVSLFEEILSTGALISSKESVSIYQSDLLYNTKDRGHNPVIYVVENILSKKLNVAPFLLTGKLKFSACLQSVSTGKVSYPNLPPDDQEEYIRMANIRVNLLSDASVFPKNTASYSFVLWPTAGQFIETVKRKDPSVLGEFLSPIDYCIHGLCISTTYINILNLLYLP